MPHSPVSGVIAAAATPLRLDRAIDHEKLVAHCRRLLASGCDGINLLGTTGEATSFSAAERLATMRAIAKSGLPLERLMVGTGAANLADAATLTAAARDLGFAGALLLPPFYYKNIDAESVVAYVEAVVAAVGARDLRLYLYHFPQLSGVPYAIEAVAALHERHPETVFGVKDSSGDLAYSTALTRRLPKLAVFPSAEGALAQAQELGFAGCISATANVTGPFAGPAFHRAGTPEAAESLGKAVAIRAALSSVPLIAAVRWALADLSGEASWRMPLLPLRALNVAEERQLRERLAGTAYESLRPAFARAAE
jgi:4-hydroxy-tetrahydrodipicolinate synthase